MAGIEAVEEGIREKGVQPDLVLRVEHQAVEGGIEVEYSLEVRNRFLGLEIHERKFPCISLPFRIEEVLAQYFEDMEKLQLVAGGQENLAQLFFESKGVRLGERLLPQSLRQSLWSFHSRRTPPTLLLLTDETWIPWELIRLRQPEGRESDFLLRVANEGMSDGDGIGGESYFLIEIFSMTRWLSTAPQRWELPLSEVGLIVPTSSDLPSADSERQGLQELLVGAQTVEPTLPEVLDRLVRGVHDGLHFTGFAIREISGPSGLERVGMCLDEREVLTPDHLGDSARNLGRRRPWVFFNACHSARDHFSLSGLGGFAEAFLSAGVGSFIGSYWQVPDSRARDFALALYGYFTSGRPLGESARLAREWLRRTYPGDPTFLAYAVYGHPLAVRNEGVAGWSEERLPIAIPSQTWTMGVDSPAALLRAEYQIVPFHGRDRERDEFDEWCMDGRPLAVRLLTGDGGMGKTRLQIEMAQRRDQEGWFAGFLTKDAADRAPAEAWRVLVARRNPLFLVIDYAETRIDLVAAIVRAMLGTRREKGIQPARLVLLARHGGDWWDLLRREGQGVGDFLQGPSTTHFSLQSLGLDRTESYFAASRRFSEVLGLSESETAPGELGEKIYERVLFVHMKALVAAQNGGKEERDGRDPILDYLLLREERFWSGLAEKRSVPRNLVRGIRRAMGLFTLGGGAKTQFEAVQALRGMEFFSGVEPRILEDIARVLHDAYADEQRFIAPLQPDTLGEHLIHREMEKGAVEFIDSILPP